MNIITAVTAELSGKLTNCFAPKNNGNLF